MKYFAILFVLFVATSAQALSCEPKGLDSYGLNSSSYASTYNEKQPNEFYSMILDTMQGVNYTPDPTLRMQYSNSSIVIYNGFTGNVVLEGWFWNFIQNGMEYRLQKVHGQIGNCSSVPAGPIMQTTKVLKSLNTIFPPPGVIPKPGEICIAQGLTGQPKPDTIMSVVWTPGAEQELDYFTTLSRNSSIHTKVKELRKLTEKEIEKYFKNPCKPATISKVENDKHWELIDEVYKLIRVWG